MPLRGADPRRWLVGFDFDGTLSPIVQRPETARLDPALKPLMQALAGLVGWVVVVSGRPRRFLERRLPGVLCLGSYGLELPPELSASGMPDGFPAEEVRARLEGARAALGRDLPDGASIEVKPWGVAMHYRGAGEAFDEGRAWELVNRVADDARLAVQRGRLVFELKPREAADKGWALRLAAERLRPSAASFTGDDLGDRPAWVALKGLDGPTLAVGIASSELPPEALEACDLVLQGRDELPAFLRALAGAARSARQVG